MLNNLEKLRYRELLEKEQYFDQKNQSFYQENENEFFELLTFDIRMADQFYYHQKENYRRLIEDYLSGIITDLGFVWTFFPMYKQDTKDFEILRKDFEKLVSFPIESKSAGFSRSLDDIFENCDSLSLVPDNMASHEIDESQFKEYFEIIYSEMQKYFDK